MTAASVFDTRSPIPTVFPKNDNGVVTGWRPTSKEASAVYHWQAHELIVGDKASVVIQYDKATPAFHCEGFGRRRETELTDASIDALRAAASTQEDVDFLLAQVAKHDVERITLFGTLVGQDYTQATWFRRTHRGTNHYQLDDREFILEDVLVDGVYYLQQDVVDEYAEALGLRRPALIASGAITDVLEGFIEQELLSNLPKQERIETIVRAVGGREISRTEHVEQPHVPVAGIVLRPLHELRTQHGDRVIGKLTREDANALAGQADLEQAELALEAEMGHPIDTSIWDAEDFANWLDGALTGMGYYGEALPEFPANPAPGDHVFIAPVGTPVDSDQWVEVDAAVGALRDAA